MRPRGSPAERTGVVVMRVWIEPAADPASGLRIRITETPDIERGESVTVAVASVTTTVACAKSTPAVPEAEPLVPW